MNVGDLQSWIGIVGVVFGAGVAYQSLHSRIKSLEERQAKTENAQAEYEKENAHKLDRVLDSVNKLGTVVARIEERIHKSL